ncbi:MAG: arsenate reductase (glutaredoxin) [Sedimenticola sp.]
MSVEIYYNPSCSKCRQTLKLLEDQGVAPEVKEYLNTPPSREELVKVLDMLGIEPRELMRQKETEYKEAGLDNLELTRNQLIQGMLNHPRLIERPIVIKDGKAAIGRPPEKVLEIL